VEFAILIILEGRSMFRPIV